MRVRGGVTSAAGIGSREQTYCTLARERTQTGELQKYDHPARDQPNKLLPLGFTIARAPLPAECAGGHENTGQQPLACSTPRRHLGVPLLATYLGDCRTETHQLGRRCMQAAVGHMARLWGG